MRRSRTRAEGGQTKSQSPGPKRAADGRARASAPQRERLEGRAGLRWVVFLLCLASLPRDAQRQVTFQLLQSL